MSAAIIDLRQAQGAHRPENPAWSEELAYCSTVAIGLDAMEDGTAVAFRRVGETLGVIPCPDAATACTVLLLLHREIVSSAKARDLDWRCGFNAAYVEAALDDLFAFCGPVVKILQENGVTPFDQAFDRDAHMERLTDGIERVTPQV